jgi:hypothetical protein
MSWFHHGQRRRGACTFAQAIARMPPVVVVIAGWACAITPSLAQTAQAPSGAPPSSATAPTPPASATPAESATSTLTGQSEPRNQTPAEEQVDPTRLDVERMPPDFLRPRREMYEHGLFIEGMLGGRVFTSAAGQLLDPGMYAAVGPGYELAPWLMCKLLVEFGLHATDAPSPPAKDIATMLGTIAELDAQFNLGPALALWLGGQVGAIITLGDVLDAYGLNNSDRIGLTYGGVLGLDWHFRDLRRSIGIVGGVRAYPSLDVTSDAASSASLDSSMTLGVHGAMYLRHVF